MANALGPPGLKLVDVSKRWCQRNVEIPVLREAQLHAPRGAVTWIGGSNGAGKTTLLRIAAGVLEPDRGRVLFDGIDPRRERAKYRQGMGFLSAGDRGIYARLSVRRHLDLWARLALIAKPQRRGAVDAAVAQFGLDGLESRRADRLSLGQRQRVKLAMTFLHQPRLVLLDEPCNSLDSTGIRILSEAIGRTILNQGCVVFCSPPRERALEFEHAFLIEEGRLVAA